MSPRAERLLIALLTAINVTHLVDFVIIMPLGPELMRVFGIGAGRFGLAVSIYTLAAGVAALLAAFVIDRFDRRRVVLLVYAGFTLATFACALAPTYPALLAARAAAGAFGGVLGAVVFTIVGDCIPYERRGAATGIVMSAFSLATILGVPAGLLLAEWSSWHTPFVALGIASALVWCACWFALPSLRGHLRPGDGSPLRRAASSLRRILARSSARWAFALTVALMAAGFSVIPFFAPYLSQNVGFTARQLALVYLVGGCCTVLSSPLIGRLSDRFGKHGVFAAVALASTLPILVVTHLPPVPLALALVCTTAFMVLVSGRFVPATALITGAVQPQDRGGFMSLNSSLQSFAGAIATAIAGASLGQDADGRFIGYGRIGIAASVATLLCIVVAMRVRADGETSPPALTP